MSPRLYYSGPIIADAMLDLPPSAARHAQVLRLQPGDTITLFGHDGGEWEAKIVSMGRQVVTVAATKHHALSREAMPQVHLAMGLVANERMDFMIEKATELGAVSFSPILADRCVLRLSGDRADKRVQHWQAIAIAACEQSGRNTVPTVHPIQSLRTYLEAPLPSPCAKALLSLDTPSLTLHQWAAAANRQRASLCLLSGPEGGWTPSEELQARASGFQGLTLGQRVLRADTAPLAALAALTLSFLSDS
jgi:16S rRNA (uracil1498-N3)-methyltransferase